jgi:hypothetical protein
MAAVTRLKKGTRVRLKRSVETAFKNIVPMGLEGRVSKHPPLEDIVHGGLLFWIIWDKPNHGRVGNWIPYQALVRLRLK